MNDDENDGLELKDEIGTDATVDSVEDDGIEAATFDTGVKDDVRKVKGRVGGPTPPRIGGKAAVSVLVDVTMDVTDVFAVGSNTPELAHAENEAKYPRNGVGTLPIKFVTVP